MATTATELENLAALVAVGQSIRDAASEIGLTHDQAYKITCTAEFKARVHSLRTEKTESLAGMALGAAEDAIRELRVLATTAEKDSDRISACKAILDKVLPLAENAELRRRLDDLERAASEADQEARGSEAEHMGV